ncbi:MAG TPA: DUF6356 family protein [Gammaproteobacteria bacterium]|nr:DUF6356 family protein [Gammaproteobacteria bacterium]
MSVLSRLFSDHPASVNESYWQHFASAMGFGLQMIWGGLVCIVHAIVPGFCCTKASEMIGELHDRMITNRKRLAVNERAPMPTRRAA